MKLSISLELYTCNLITITNLGYGPEVSKPRLPSRVTSTSNSKLLCHNIFKKYFKIKFKNYIHDTTIVPIGSNILINPLGLSGKKQPISHHSNDDLSKQALNVSFQLPNPSLSLESVQASQTQTPLILNWPCRILTNFASHFLLFRISLLYFLIKLYQNFSP